MLSEEEKKLLKIFKSQVEKEETEYFSVNAYTQLLYDSHKTVLNLITKLQKENDLLNEYVKENEIYKKNLFNYAKKKEKIIDLMAEYIANRDNDEDICKYQVAEWCEDEEDGVLIEVCRKCIKQYFERKCEE